jgi:formylglycine-generating enzyme required for sulfatase activity
VSFDYKSPLKRLKERLKMMKKRTILVGVLLLFAVLAVSAQQPVVAVAPFDAISGISATEANMITRVFFIRLGNTNRVSLVDRGVVEQVIREHRFQSGDWSNQQKTAELGSALNADWIVRGELEKFGNNILVTVQFYDIQTFRFMGGADLRLANADAAYDNMDPLVDKLVETISATGRAPAARPASPGRPGAVPEGFVRIEGGTFTMGSDSTEPNRSANETQRRVTISPFHMGKHQVTQAEYEEIMGANPSNFKGFNLPVENVSWLDAIDYCNRRSIKEGLTPAYTISGTNATWNRQANGYRLPTEAEWEYACRAGTTTPFNTGFNITTNQANYDGNYPYNNNAKGTYRQRTTPVGSFAPNAWGLYDMHGNVWEWCWDWFGEYGVASQTDPTGPAGGSNRVLRGGSWYLNGQGLRSAARNCNAPTTRYAHDGGFRLVRP